LFIVLAAAAAARSEPPLYRPKVLGSLPGGSTFAYQVSNSGRIIGNSGSTQGLPGLHAFVCGLDGQPINIDTIGFDGSVAVHMNRNGVIAGTGAYTVGGGSLGVPFRYTDAAGMELLSTGVAGTGAVNGINAAGDLALTWTVAPNVLHAFVIRASGEAIDLGTFGGPSAYAVGINDAGQVAGAAQADYYHAFLWTDGELLDLGTLGGAQSWARAMNEGAQVVGQAQLSPTGWHAFRWSPGLGMQDLHTLPSAISSDALRINRNGTVMGTFLRPEYRTGTFYYTDDEGMVDIGVVGSADVGSAQGYMLNDRDEIVGRGNRDGQIETFAFYYSRTTGIIDLNEHLTESLPPPLRLTDAVEINEKGQIIARARYISVFYSILLTPVTQELRPTNASAAELSAAGEP
jgi:probable HAF family extracellular repeat protein